MYFDNYLVSEAVMLDVTVTSKKQLFQMMSEKLVDLPELKALNLPARDVVNAILERERLGSTGVGREETRERLRAAPDSQALYISMIQRANAA